MPDPKEDAKKALEEHRAAFEAARHKCEAAIKEAHVKQRLEKAVTHYKAAAKTFHDEALACINF